MTTKNKKKSKTHKNKFSNVQIITLAIIIISIIVVFISLIAAIIMQPERQIHGTIEKLASEYYEDYYYEIIINSEEFKNQPDLNSVLGKYQEKGFSAIPLSELLLYDSQKNQAYANFLTKYCDENETTIKFYPDPPFEKTSYHTEYSYSCNF